MSGVWNRIRGELVEIPGLVGDFLIEWGQALDRWTRRHRWSKRDLEEFADEERVAIDCVVAGCRWGDSTSAFCECRPSVPSTSEGEGT